jgi:23S rRNA pseudouridine1911/1915/1917 synthase
MDEPRSTKVAAAQHDATLAAVVRSLYAGMPWSKARELVAAGKVEVDGAKVLDPATRVREGAAISVNPSARKQRAAAAGAIDIVYVDRELVVVRKPAGLLTVPFDEHDERDTLLERTRAALRARERGQGKGGKKHAHEWLGVVQRLDKDTSGLLVFARTQAARQALANQFRAHSIARRYVALAWGHVEPGVHESYLIGDRGDGRRGSWRGPNPPAAAKRALTRVEVVQRFTGSFGAVTLVACGIETGRQHQIRIHLAEAGHPLLGERVYDREWETRPIACEHTLLHATSLGVRHPTRDEPLHFDDPPPPAFAAMLARLTKP